MLPVFQTLTITNNDTGDCFNACVASVLELTSDKVKDVTPSSPGVWYLNWQDWFEKRGYSLECVSKLYPPKGYSLVSVETTRVFPVGHSRAGDPISHTCVAFNGEIVHDPYPGGSVVERILYYHEIIRIEEHGVSDMPSAQMGGTTA